MAIHPDSSRNVGFTTEGGLAVRLLNKTGAASVKGTVVEASTTTAGAFAVAGADENHPIGVVYESGIADGSACWVVVAGIAQVLLQDSTASTVGYWVRTSVTAAGRADATNAAPPSAGIPELEIHMCELGHALETVTAGTDKLANVLIHFN